MKNNFYRGSKLVFYIIYKCQKATLKVREETNVVENYINFGDSWELRQPLLEC